MNLMDQLAELRACGGAARTRGLPDEVILRFADRDPRLAQAVNEAREAFKALREEDPAFLELDENEQVQAIQAGFVNFYALDVVNPYVSLAGAGPWIVTLKGAVLHDSGGYGMLGHGHAPDAVLAAMSGRQVMANVMTSNYSQMRLVRALRAEIGHRRGGCPYERFVCLNSGSEVVTVAARIADINARQMTDPGGRHANRRIRSLSLRSGFHGRTERPARFSDATRKTYTRYLASFRDRDDLITVAPNDIEQLEQVYAYADKNDLFLEAFFMEPVMGEGNPGQAITPEFYARARELTRAHGSVLLVDSIQAGLRAHGVLSICDYPGFEDLEAPDMEAYSKALNAGQYPLSVLALNGHAVNLYQKGVYGNTMTSNPRAMDVGCAVLRSLTPELRRNIVERGREFQQRLRQLASELDGRIVNVQGTGLLFSIELDASRYKAFGEGSVEEYMRERGINVIHGGQNSLRYTPHFGVTGEEVSLIVEATRDALLNGPVKAGTDTTATAAA